MYIQLQEQEDKIAAFSEKLYKYCSTNGSGKYSPIKNEIVCCKFKDDGCWYRGQVIGKRGNIYKVFFIDFGNTDDVLGEEMKPLPMTFSSHKLSLCVSLQNVPNEALKELIPKLTNEYWDMKVLDQSSEPVQVLLSQKGKPLIDFIHKNPKENLVYQKLPEKICEVMLCHSEEGTIYVQQIGDTQAIGDLCNRINSAAGSMPPAKEISLDNLYCALFNDGLWYRVTIEKELSTIGCQNQYRVVFIDFGNQETVDLKNLRELPEEFYNFPVFAVRVIPANVKISQLQMQVVYQVEVVDEKAGVMLVNFLNVEKKLPLLSSIKKCVFEDNITEASVCENQGDIFYCLRTSDIDKYSTMAKHLDSCPVVKIKPEALSVSALVNAKHGDEPWCRGSVTKILDDTSYEIFFIDLGKTEIIPLNNLSQLPEAFAKHPIFAVPVKIVNLEEVRNLVDLTKPLMYQTVGKITDDIQLVEVVFQNIIVNHLKKQSLPLDKVTEITLCHKEENVFFCQMVENQSQIKSLESKLATLSVSEPLTKLPGINVIIAAKFTDNVWYRGSVEKIDNSLNSCKIWFFDYGNFETISLDNMRFLPKDLYSFPIFSIPIMFSNLEELQNLNSDATTFFAKATECIDNGVQMIKIVNPAKEKPVFTSVDPKLLSDLPTEVIVCHEENSIYYVQQLSDVDALQNMMVSLQTPGLEAIEELTVEVGQLFCVKFIDGLWYRGLIEENLGNEKFKVLFIDYGNKDEIHRKDIMHMPDSCRNIPMFMIPIKLCEENIHTTCLSVDKTYFMKRVKCLDKNLQLVRVKPTLKPVLLSNMKSSLLDKNLTLVKFQSFSDDGCFLIKSSDFDNFEEMNQLLKVFVGESVFDSPAVDEVVIVKGTDKNWYRASVKAVNIRPSICQVFLIDKGITEDIPVYDIYYITEQLASFPLFYIKAVFCCNIQETAELIGKDVAVQVLSANSGTPSIQIMKHYMLCSLAKQHLPPHTLKKVSFCYRDGDILFLQDLSQLPLLAEVFQEVQNSSVPIVHKPKIGELLVAQSSLDGLRYRCCVEETMSCDTYKIHFIDYGNSEVVPKEKLCCFNDKLFKHTPFCAAVKLIDPAQKIELDKEYSLIAESLPQSNEPQLVKLVSDLDQQQTALSVDDRSNTSNQKTSSDSSTQKYFHDNCNYVPFLNGEQDIIVYSPLSENYAFCAPYNEKNLTASMQLTSEITEYCANLTSVTSYESGPPEKEEMVLAKYEDAWYRAVIISTDNAPNYEVLFVDYGNSEIVSMELLRQMKEKFMSLEIQAHLCQLTGFQSQSDSDKITEEIKQNFVFKPLKGVATIVEDDLQLYVNDIVEHLKKKNLASS